MVRASSIIAITVTATLIAANGLASAQDRVRLPGLGNVQFGMTQSAVMKLHPDAKWRENNGKRYLSRNANFEGLGNVEIAYRFSNEVIDIITIELPRNGEENGYPFESCHSLSQAALRGISRTWGIPSFGPASRPSGLTPLGSRDLAEWNFDDGGKIKWEMWFDRIGVAKDYCYLWITYFAGSPETQVEKF